MVVNSVVLALVITIIVGVALLLIINVIEFFFYVRTAYRLMKRIDLDPWNMLDAARVLDVTPAQVRILYTKFCEVRNSLHSLFRSTK